MFPGRSIAARGASSPDNPPMHLVIPFAAPLSDAGRAAMAQLKLPGLAARLSTMEEASRDEGDEWSLSPPHERALARERGWVGADGCLPFAAHGAVQDGLDPGDLAWGLVTPVHWRLGTEQVSLMDPEHLGLDEAASRELFEAVEPLFTSEGFAFAWGGPTRWYAAHETLSGLPTASLDRVIGRNVDPWLTSQPEARLVRRLQNEVQMLLHTHPLNADREARGLPVVNSFWLSGCGVAQPTRPKPVRAVATLRRFALAEDWAQWARAWQLLDAEIGHAALERLTLCGERTALSFQAGTRGLLGRLAARLRKADPLALLDTL